MKCISPRSALTEISKQEPNRERGFKAAQYSIKMSVILKYLLINKFTKMPNMKNPAALS